MTAYIQGANPNSLQRKSVRYEWNDEVWCWDDGMMREAWSRTEAFRRICKILNVSQAGDTMSEWEVAYNGAKRYVYGVHCLQCGKLQPLEFFAHMYDDESTRAGIVWSKSARQTDGRWNIDEAGASARFKCCYCGHEHDDEPRVWAHFDRHGEYLDMDPERNRTDCSVRWNGLAVGDWGRLVRKFLRACEVRDQGSTMQLEQFYKKDLALFWDPGVATEKVELVTSGYVKEAPFADGYKTQKLEWETLRVITADYQQGRGNDTRHLIVVCRAWGANGRSRLLWEGRLNSFEELYQLQTALEVTPRCVAIDGGFNLMEVAAQAAKYGWTILLGDDAATFLHKRKKRPPVRLPYSPRFAVDPAKGTAGQGRRLAYGFRWSNPTIKNQLFNLRHGAVAVEWELPSDISPSYREGIDSEAKRREMNKKTGVAKWVWVQLHPNNHAWDCECMQVVVAIIAGTLSFDVEVDVEAPAPPQPAHRSRTAPVAPHQTAEQLELFAR